MGGNITMFEKVNPYHPDKVADRIAGAIVDQAYTSAQGGWMKSNPRIAVEVLVGHNNAMVIIETSLSRGELSRRDVNDILQRLCPDVPEAYRYIIITHQDEHLSRNQEEGVRVGDNGIFKGKPVREEQKRLVAIARHITEEIPSDGKYILDGTDVTICQSCMSKLEAVALRKKLQEDEGLYAIINPLGEWTGGTSVDSGATNRKLGSDMGDAVTGGGLHGKDLSKADVSVNIACHIKAQAAGCEVVASTAIGDEKVVFRYESGRIEKVMYKDVVEQARLFILRQYGSFEKFAEWGLIA